MAATPDIRVAPLLTNASKLLDPHCRSTLLLVESLIHGLVDKGVLSIGEAIDIIDVASDVEAEIAHASNGHGRDEFSLLDPLAKSLRGELGE